MKTFVKVLAISGLMCGVSSATFAASHSMDMSKVTCADFAAMDEAGQMDAMKGMVTTMTEAGTLNKDGEGLFDVNDAPAVQEQVALTITACESDPDMMAMDASGLMDK